MDNIEKLRVILQHWIDHNGGHVDEFEKWRQLMNNEGKTEIAASLEEAKTQMNKISDLLAAVLKDIGEPVAGDHHHH
ncbi:MAG: hypothetical protein CSA26_04820 [Desulfobacterales bacterium]|nr:MAG: hypothetical protein CSA26_04820 [Desulfobacterales bacterium]